MEVYDYNAIYAYSPWQDDKCRFFTKLMYFITINNIDLSEIREEWLQSEEINRQNEHGWTALMIAVRNYLSGNNKAIVKLLLKHGADVNLRDKKGYSALLWSYFFNNGHNFELVELLIKHGANVNFQQFNGFSILMIMAEYSCQDNNLRVIKLLLEHGADVHLQGCFRKRTALKIALERECGEKTVELLLKYGANIYIINIKDVHKSMKKYVKQQHQQLIKNLGLKYKAALIYNRTHNTLPPLEIIPEEVYKILKFTKR